MKSKYNPSLDFSLSPMTQKSASSPPLPIVGPFSAVAAGLIARPAPRHRLLSRRLHHHPPRTAPVRPGPEPPALRCRRSSRTTRRGQRPPAAPPEPPRPCGAAAPARGAFSTIERGQRPPRGPRSRPGRMCSPRYSPRSSSGPPGKSPAPPRPPTAVPAGLTEHLDVALGDGVEGAAGQQDNVGLGGLRHGPGPAQPQPLFVSRCGCGGGREGGREERSGAGAGEGAGPWLRERGRSRDLPPPPPGAGAGSLGYTEPAAGTGTREGPSWLAHAHIKQGYKWTCVASVAQGIGAVGRHPLHAPTHTRCLGAATRCVPPRPSSKALEIPAVQSSLHTPL